MGTVTVHAPPGLPTQVIRNIQQTGQSLGLHFLYGGENQAGDLQFEKQSRPDGGGEQQLEEERGEKQGIVYVQIGL